VAALGATALPDDRLLPNPAAVLRTVGRGRVVYVPADLFRDFAHNRYPLTRAFIGELARRLAGALSIKVQAPTGVDVVLRRKGRRTLIHFVNRTSGVPNQPNNGAIEEIPPVGPIRVTVRRARRPASVRLAFEAADLRWSWGRGVLSVRVPHVRIHAALVVG
jgi:CRP-like cAMP-binding protein